MASRIERYRRPELFLADLIRREATEEFGNERLLYRATVLAVDLEGGLLQNESGVGTFQMLGSDGRRRSFPATVGPRNPRGSIKARILTNGMDRLSTDAETRVFWPLFPQDQMSMPISPGEHVYVLFEGAGTAHGLWMSRVAGHESANSFKGSDSYSSTQEKSAADAFIGDPGPQGDDSYAGEAPLKSAADTFIGES